MYYVYLLESQKTGDLYIGSTNNLRRRVQDHNKEKSFSTKRYVPWKLIYYEAYIAEILARMREKRLKYHGNAIRELKKRAGLSRTSLQRKHGAGFTLIELMVVMAILAILVGIGAGSFTSSQRKSRDSTRKANLKAMATALELYYLDKGIYPSDDGGGGMKGCGADDAPTVCAPNSIFQDANGTIYMQQFPTDPSPAQKYYYISPATNQYKIYAHLENLQDPAIMETPYSCAGGAGEVPCNFGISSTNIRP